MNHAIDCIEPRGRARLGRLGVLLLAAVSTAAGGAVAGEGVSPWSDARPEDWAEGGVEACIDCHDETEERPILAILQRPHGLRADPRTPLGSEHGCETCHGPSARHMVKPPPGEERAPTALVFGPETPPAEQNAPCLSCHAGGERMHWAGSVHEREGLACVSCHTVHAAFDPVLENDQRPEGWRRSQSETCFGCHVQERAQIHRLSSHPFKEGKVACSDCHQPHGSPAPALLAEVTLNQTCYRCHAEKRGPFLWEHAPAREDCTNCHTPHGSNHPMLLKARGPWLCQQCHMAGFHPSTAYTGNGLPGPSAADQMLGRNCLNCHTEVHGSNHPSGPRFTR